MINTASIVITPEMLRGIAEIDEFKGAWRALGQLAPERLAALRHVATIESIGSSTRIEGSRLSDREVDRLLGNLQIAAFTSRDEQEVVGYAETMHLIFSSCTEITFTESHVRQLHRGLLAHSATDDWHRGGYKTSSNSVVAFDEHGRQVGVVFETASPADTPRLMGELVGWVNQEVGARRLHPLLIIGVFVVVFLEIHPFQDGNGRLSRILTTLLLLHAGYVYVPYSSLESAIEMSKDRYYVALRQTQGSIRTDSPDWRPWLHYFIEALRLQVAQLETKLGRERLLAETLPALSVHILDHVRDHGRATVRELVAVTDANRNTVKAHLHLLVQRRQIVLHGAGRGSWYGLR